MANDSYSIRDVFSHYIVIENPTGPKAEIAEFLKANDLSRAAFKKVVKTTGMNLRSLKEDLLDLLLFYIRFCLRDHQLSSDEKLAIHHLKITFEIKERDFYNFRQEEIRELLTFEIKRLLADQRIDKEEAVHQVDLQTVFGLSYDLFLELTHDPAEQIINEWIAKIASDGNVTEEERENLFRQILALDRAYRLTRKQQKVIDNEISYEYQTYSDYQSSQSTSGKQSPGIDSKIKHAYETLGVSPGTSQDEIQSAYRRMAKLHHPDRIQHIAPEYREIAEIRMKEINTAYAILRQL